MRNPPMVFKVFSNSGEFGENLDLCGYVFLDKTRFSGGLDLPFFRNLFGLPFEGLNCLSGKGTRERVWTFVLNFSKSLISEELSLPRTLFKNSPIVYQKPIKNTSYPEWVTLEEVGTLELFHLPEEILILRTQESSPTIDRFMDPTGLDIRWSESKIGFTPWKMSHGE